MTFIVLRIAISACPGDAARRASGFSPGGSGTRIQGSTAFAGEIWGTLYTSILALVIGTAFGLAAAIFLSEGYLGQVVFRDSCAVSIFICIPSGPRFPTELEDLLKQLIELLAAIPSVVYGLWGLFVVIPLIRPAVQLAAPENWVGCRSSPPI